MWRKRDILIPKIYIKFHSSIEDTSCKMAKSAATYSCTKLEDEAMFDALIEESENKVGRDRRGLQIFVQRLTFRKGFGPGEHQPVLEPKRNHDV